MAFAVQPFITMRVTFAASCDMSSFRVGVRFGLADGIMPPKRYPGEAVPKGYIRDEVAELLATTQGQRAADRRDRAIVMLLVTYGLRAGEVAGLTLDDISWHESRLTVRRSKTGCTHHYPLSHSVGQALVRYLREVRPEHQHRAVFLTLQAPLRPITSKVVYYIVRNRLGRLGKTGRPYGSHALRHGVAQHLLGAKLPMKVVSDYLGHRHITSTATYAKVQLGALREVSEIDLGGVL